MDNLVAAPVLLPLMGSAITLVVRSRPAVQRITSLACLTLMVVVAGVLTWSADVNGPTVLWLGAWPDQIGIVLVADRLSAILLLISGIVSLLVMVFSLGQDLQERRRETPMSIFHPTFLLLTAGVSNAFLTGDLFNLFVGFEILLFASYVLLTLGGTGERIRAGSTYVIVSIVSSLLFLVAIACVYGATGTVMLADLALRLQELPDQVQLIIHLLLLVVFGIKAAIFPMSAWLPDSYPTAPGPVTAVFAGLLTKVGVYAIIRTETLLFPDSEVGPVLMVVALLTMIVGILGAVAQSEIKRMLSFTLVSHIGYMVFGVALASEAGLAGAIFYTVHHITIQSTLFLVAGLIERRGGSTSLTDLGGLMAMSPVLSVLFFVPAMNLAGIPPMSGFIGKVGLLQAGVETGQPLELAVVGVALVTSLLTLLAMAKVWNRAFWRKVPDAVEGSADQSPRARGRRMPRSMVLTAAAMVALGLGLSVVAGPLYDYALRAAADLLAPIYLDAVVGVVR
ncbi:MAG TPA: Na+/H+ antiporter subunit D [Candidatus Avipropionibacterium avicola]|uniref:Na+/H+ antiporter subunit D n=1 Tax=Candidatus Avipropionibacterium avicola TaxID=2840701 RepID=A0A9D1GZC3_9ACTN|nr:Na+/H+ antiporter subunit D [Candidatus Avipropionibacterium avicola]